MSMKKVAIILLIILTLFSLPIYSEGYENTSIIKLVLQLVFYLIVFIAVIFIALYGTKLVAKNTKGMSSSKYINLLDAINIPGGSKIIIAEINEMIYILSTNNNGVSVIDIIEGKDFSIIEENFDTYLDKYLTKNKLDYQKLNEGFKSFITRSKRIQAKEDRNDEK